jgi:hypothetical protein
VGLGFMALISTAFTLSCGGRLCTFFAALAVTPPFLFVIGWILHLRSAVPDFPLSRVEREVGKSFCWFAALPILIVWIVATLFNRNERNA